MAITRLDKSETAPGALDVQQIGNGFNVAMAGLVKAKAKHAQCGTNAEILAMFGIVTTGMDQAQMDAAAQAVGPLLDTVQLIVDNATYQKMAGGVVVE